MQAAGSAARNSASRRRRGGKALADGVPDGMIWASMGFYGRQWFRVSQNRTRGDARPLGFVKVKVALTVGELCGQSAMIWLSLSRISLLSMKDGYLIHISFHMQKMSTAPNSPLRGGRREAPGGGGAER